MVNRAFYFAAIERTQQDTNQTVNTLGLFPESDGVYPTPFRENVADGEADDDPQPVALPGDPLRAQHQHRPYAAGLRAAPTFWSTSQNSVQLDQREPQLGDRRGSKLNEFVFQYANFKNGIPLSSVDP